MKVMFKGGIGDGQTIELPEPLPQKYMWPVKQSILDMMDYGPSSHWADEYRLIDRFGKPSMCYYAFVESLSRTLKPIRSFAVSPDHRSPS